MAFVFKAERSDSLNSHRITPAPGQYLGPSDYRFEQNPAPFLTNSVRMPDNSHTVDLPELEPHVVIIKNSVRGDHNRQVMRSNHAQVPNTARPSANFQSKIERFNQPLRDIPGPGSYSRNSRMGKRYNMPPLDSSRGQASQRVLPRNKSVPSIPSQIHSHGYCEGPEGDLVLNEHPIEETQQLPGARCHEMKDGQNQLQNVKKVKGAPWSKSSEKTVQSYIPKVATIDMVGPGTYEAQERGSLSNRRPSCGFESKVERNCSIKIRRSVSTTRMRPSYHPALPLNHLSETVRQAGEEEDESGEYEEYVKDCTPGPGYYYNASTASSFYSKATSIRSRKSEGEGAKELAIGSNTERFKEFVGAAGDLGPGAYEIKRDLNKKEMSYKKIPFRTSDLRFEKVKISNDLGPGAYQIQVKMGKDFSNKTKKAGEESMIEGLPGSKIRIEDVLSDNKRMMKNKTPGPGDYNPKVMSEIGNSVKDERESYSFASRLRREIMKPNTDIPPVGSYNVNQLDIATKVIKEEDDLDELGPKKPAFNSSNPRFKGNNTLEDSDDDEEVNWKPRQDLASVLKAQKPPKKSVMFASKVKRMEGDETKTLIPGPGSYHNVKQSDWTKQTFNVNFSNANFT